MEVMSQIKKTKAVGQLPLLPYSSMVLNGAIWMTYGAILSNPGIWLPNIPAVILGSYYWMTYYNHCPPGASHLPGTMPTHFAAVGAIAAGVVGVAACMPVESAQTIIGVTGDVICVAMFAGPLAAIKTVIEEKSTQSLPFAFTCATFVNCSLWSVYGLVVLSDPYVWIPNILGLGSSIVQIGLFAKYGFHDDHDKVAQEKLEAKRAEDKNEQQKE